MGLSWKKIKRGALAIGTGGMSEVARKLDKSSPGSGPSGALQVKRIREGYGGALADEAQVLGSIPETYAKAKKLYGQGKGRAIQAAQDYGAQADAQTQQSMVSRGLFNTTALDNARQGVSYQTSQQVADIENQFAAIEAGLGLKEAQEKSQSRLRSGQLRIGMSQALNNQTNYNQQQQQAWEMAQNEDAWLDSLFNIGGTLLGYGLAGGFNKPKSQYNEGYGGS